jgi:hypothetical protein
MNDKDSFENQGLIEQIGCILDYLKSEPNQTVVPPLRVELLEKTLRGDRTLDGLLSLDKILDASKDLFDNMLGWSNGRQPYAPRGLWAKLGEVLYTKDNERVEELINK